MSCEGPWTQQDEYDVYPDCHVWAPFYTISASVVISFACINGLISVSRLHVQGHRLTPFLLTLHCFGMIAVYSTRLATGLVLGSRNVLLNFFHGLSLSFLWGVAGIIPLQYLEVLLMTEKLKERAEEHFLKRVRVAFRIIIWSCAVLCTLFFTVFSAVPALPLSKSYWLLIVFGCSAYSVVIWYYGIGVRRLLQSMQVSKSFYAGLIRRLDLFVIPWTVMVVPAIINCSVFMMVPFLARNSYILLGSLMMICGPLTSFILYTSATPPKINNENHHTPEPAGSFPYSEKHSGGSTNSKKELGNPAASGTELLDVSASRVLIPSTPPYAGTPSQSHLTLTPLQIPSSRLNSQNNSRVVSPIILPSTNIPHENQERKDSPDTDPDPLTQVRIITDQERNCLSQNNEDGEEEEENDKVEVELVHLPILRTAADNAGTEDGGLSSSQSHDHLLIPLEPTSP